MGFPAGARSKEPPCQCRRQSDVDLIRVRMIPSRRKWQPAPVFFPRESHGQRSLVGYSAVGRKELDMNEATRHAGQYRRKNWRRRGLFSQCGHKRFQEPDEAGVRQRKDFTSQRFGSSLRPERSAHTPDTDVGDITPGSVGNLQTSDFKKGSLLSCSILGDKGMSKQSSEGQT